MERKFRKILIAVDQSPPSMWAVRVGGAMATEMGAEILVVHVVNSPAMAGEDATGSRKDLLVQLRRKGRALLRKMTGALGEAIVKSESLREGKPAEEILAAAKEWGAQLIVIGAYGQSRLGHLLLGSTAETIARSAKCPVVTVPHESTANAAAHAVLIEL